MLANGTDVFSVFVLRQQIRHYAERSVEEGRVDQYARQCRTQAGEKGSQALFRDYGSRRCQRRSTEMWIRLHANLPREMRTRRTNRKRGTCVQSQDQHGHTLPSASPTDGRPRPQACLPECLLRSAAHPPRVSSIREWVATSASSIWQEMNNVMHNIKAQKHKLQFDGFIAQKRNARGKQEDLSLPLEKKKSDISLRNTRKVNRLD